MIDLITLTSACKDFRIKLGYKQTDVADATGYSAENVSSFETGRNNNALLLYWYVEHGFRYGGGNE